MTGAAAAIASAGRSSTLAVTANNVTAVGSDFASSGTVTTEQLPNTNITGGVPPYTVLWEYDTGSTVPSVIGSTILDPVWSGMVSEGPEEIAMWTVTVTDAALQTSVATIAVTLGWFNLT